MHSRVKALTGISAILLCLMSCLSCRCLDDMPAPQPACFHIVDHNGQTNLTTARLYWYQQGIRQYENQDSGYYSYKPFRVEYQVATYDPATGQYKVDSTRPVLMSTTMLTTARAQGISTFYIEYAGRSTDTLDVVVSAETYGSRRCPTQSYFLSEVRHNGVLLQPDSNFLPYRQPVYHLHKYQ